MLQYLIKFSISLVVLYVFYRAVLRPLTFYQWNRFYLLGYSLLSFLIPFVDISEWIGDSAGDGNRYIGIIPSVSQYTFIAENPPPSFFQQLTPANWVLLVFLTGAVAMLVRVLLQYISLRRLRAKSRLLTGYNSVQLYETSEAITAFSFGNAIYINPALHTAEELQRIIQHEFVHVRQKHSIDLLMGELLCIVNWFNPFAWLIRHAIRQNLEFIADNQVLQNGIAKKDYQYLLLKVIGVPQYAIASHFNFSNLKKRIAMMNKIKTAKPHLTKFLFVLPLLAVLLLAFRGHQAGKNLTSDEKTAMEAAGRQQQHNADTLPAPAPPTAMINKKGYVLTIADNNGECVVLVKDQQRKIIKAVTLEEWNKNKTSNEARYGSIPPPPPKAVQELRGIPVNPVAPGITELPIAPALPALPSNVKNISRHTDTNTATGGNTNTATVTLINGKKEVYNLNNAAEKADYIKKYGELRQPIQPPLPVAPVEHVTPAAPLTPAAPPEKTGMVEISPVVPLNTDASLSLRKQPLAPLPGMVTLKGVNTLYPPLYFVDGKEMESGYDLNKLNPDDIESVSVWKDEKALGKFGPKAKHGVIEIVTKNSTSLPDGILFVLDGKELPAGSKIEDHVNPAAIESMNVLKDKAATIQYGEKGKHGVIEIKTKKAVKQAEKNRQINLTADSIVLHKQHIQVIGGSVTFKENEQAALVEGNFRFGQLTDLPFVVFNGKEVRDVRSFTIKKAKFSLLSLEPAQAVAKYGSRARKGALEINSL